MIRKDGTLALAGVLFFLFLLVGTYVCFAVVAIQIDQGESLSRWCGLCCRNSRLSSCRFCRMCRFSRKIKSLLSVQWDLINQKEKSFVAFHLSHILNTPPAKFFKKKISNSTKTLPILTPLCYNKTIERDTDEKLVGGSNREDTTLAPRV